MTPSNTTAATAATVPPYQRNPRRITITVPFATHQRLLNQSDDEGRSLSNLAAHLLEVSFQGR